MLAKFISHHWSNDDGVPLGGTSFGVGFCVSWQNGALGRDGERLAPNGAFVETIIAVAKDRLECYQNSKFKCEENEMAIAYLERALDILDQRTKKREQRKVEGTHEV